MPADSGPLAELRAPPEVVAGLTRLRDELAAAAGSNLQALVLFGGLAEGRYRPGKSDVNVLVVLTRASADDLSALAPALRHAGRALRVEPLLVTRTELPAAADVFPAKFLHIERRHLLLAGTDPFVGLDISREHLRLRLEQELTNQALRLRRRFVAAAHAPADLSHVLAEAAGSLGAQLRMLLELAGKPNDEDLASCLKAAAQAFDLDADALLGLATSAPRAETFPRVMESVARAAQLAARMEVGQP